MILLWPDIEPPPIEEEIFCYRFCKEKSAGFLGLQPVYYFPDSTVGNILRTCNHDRRFLVVNSPKIIISPDAGEIMGSILQGHKSAIVGPVYNEAEYAFQNARLSFPYLDMDTFREASQLLAYDQGDLSKKANRLEPACFLVDGKILSRMSKDLKISEILSHSDLKLIATGALVHKFSEYTSSGRPELIDLVPKKIRRILDVGCGRGMYGRYLRKRFPEIHLTGVEVNESMAREAGKYYDELIIAPIEDAEIDPYFDLINCADILEHIPNPWDILARLSDLLREGSYLTGSLPNVGHWTIVKALLEGRFEYIPWGLLCVTHIRFFTEASLRESLKAAGFEIDVLRRHVLEPSPKGREFVDGLCQRKIGDRKSLMTAEFVFRAKKSFKS